MTAVVVASVAYSESTSRIDGGTGWGKRVDEYDTTPSSLLSIALVGDAHHICRPWTPP